MKEKEEGSDGTGPVDCRKKLGLHFKGTGKSPVGFTQGRGIMGFRFFSIWLLWEEQIGRGKGGGSKNREMVAVVQRREDKGGGLDASRPGRCFEARMGVTGVGHTCRLGRGQDQK